MKRDEIKFNQTRWTKRSYDTPPKITKRERRKENPSYNFQFEEDLSVSEDHHDIYSPYDSGGEMPRPVISPPSKILDHDTEEHVLAENRKRMSSFRKDSRSIIESSDMKEDFFDESLDPPHVESERGWKNNNPFLPEILALLKEDPSPDWSSMNDPQEKEDIDFKDYSILTDIVSSMGESSDDRQGFKDHYQAQKNIILDSESSMFLEEEKLDEKAMKESTSDNLFHEVCSMLDESSSWSEKIEWSYEEEESSAIFPSLDESPSCMLEEEEPLCEHEQEVMESSSSLEFLCEEVEESSSPSWNMTVKVPVLLSTKIVDVNLMEALNIPDDLCEIIEIHLSIHSQNETVVLPSSYVFLSGVLMVEVIYDNGESLQQLKQTMPWEKTVCVNWKSKPQIPFADRKEYTFDRDGTGNVHYEFVQTFADPVEVEAQSVDFISYSDASVTDGKLHIDGSAQILYDFFQKQYVHI
ncbi:hypothetical protein ACQ4XT_02275 [Halobacillus faecis]